MKNKLLTLNIIILIITLSMFVWNYSIYRQIGPLLKNLEDLTAKSENYNRYREALKISGLNQVELEEFLKKYGNGDFKKTLDSINGILDEDQILSAITCVQVLLTCDKPEKFEQTKVTLLKSIHKYYKDKIEDKEEKELTENQLKFKKIYMKLKETT